MTTATNTLKVFIEALGSLDVETIANLFDDNTIQLVPFAPPGVPSKIEGEGTVKNGFLGLGMMFKELSYSNVEIVETADDNFAIAFAHAEGVLQTGAPYTQDYVFYVRLENGKIKEYREYMDSHRAADAIAQIMG